MKTTLKIVAFLSLAVLLGMMSGCMTTSGISKVVKEAGTAQKAIKMKFSGWNAHLEYESTPVYENAPAPLTASSGALTIYPVTRLESVRAGEFTVGAPGPAGAPGQTGQTGDTGETGATGSRGAVGPEGIKGTPGPAGEQGVQGPPGSVNPKAKQKK